MEDQRTDPGRPDGEPASQARLIVEPLPRFVAAGIACALGGLVLTLTALIVRAVTGFSPFEGILGTVGLTAVLAASVIGGVGGLVEGRRAKRRERPAGAGERKDTGEA